jgi:DNA uptake protein ComE-like DNA-binding protein
MNKIIKAIGIALLLVIMAVACAPAATTSNGSTATQPAPVSSAAKLNLNTATGAEFLAAVPGLGNRMVREFMEYRPYVSIRQFRREIGKYVDDAQVAQYEQYVFVPIAMNDSDLETLQQIPGLTADEAARLVAARPFASTSDFLAALSLYVSGDTIEIAKTYLGEN